MRNELQRDRRRKITPRTNKPAIMHVTTSRLSAEISCMEFCSNSLPLANTFIPAKIVASLCALWLDKTPTLQEYPHEHEARIYSTVRGFACVCRKCRRTARH